MDTSQPRFNPLELKAGSWPSGPRQVAIDAEWAAKHDFTVGDPIRIAVGGPVRPFRITGLAEFGGAETIAGATSAPREARCCDPWS